MSPAPSESFPQEEEEEEEAQEEDEVRRKRKKDSYFWSTEEEEDDGHKEIAEESIACLTTKFCNQSINIKHTNKTAFPKSALRSKIKDTMIKERTMILVEERV